MTHIEELQEHIREENGYCRKCYELLPDWHFYYNGDRPYLKSFSIFKPSEKYVLQHDFVKRVYVSTWKELYEYLIKEDCKNATDKRISQNCY